MHRLRVKSGRGPWPAVRIVEGLARTGQPGYRQYCLVLCDWPTTTLPRADGPSSSGSRKGIHGDEGE